MIRVVFPSIRQSVISITKLWVFCCALISRPFPTEESLKDEDIYKNLEDLIEYVWGCYLFFFLLFILCSNNQTTSKSKTKQNSPSSLLFRGPDTHMASIWLRFSVTVRGNKWVILHVLRWAMYDTYVKCPAVCRWHSEWRTKIKRAM